MLILLLIAPLLVVVETVSQDRWRLRRWAWRIWKGGKWVRLLHVGPYYIAEAAITLIDTSEGGRAGHKASAAVVFVGGEEIALSRDQFDLLMKKLAEAHQP